VEEGQDEVGRRGGGGVERSVVVRGNRPFASAETLEHPAQRADYYGQRSIGESYGEVCKSLLNRTERGEMTALSFVGVWIYKHVMGRV
jgi:hypothetical protein